MDNNKEQMDAQSNQQTTSNDDAYGDDRTVSVDAPQKEDAATTFINQQKMHSAADDDVYEFKSDSEDHPNSMLLNPENVRNTSNQNVVSSFETRYGLDEEEADDNDDEGNLIVDEQMEVDEFEERRRQNLPTFEIEECDEDIEEGDIDERRKVPPLRILLTKNEDASKSNLSPSLNEPGTSSTPNRKRPARKNPPGSATNSTTNEKRPGSTTGRITRGQLARQTIAVPESPSDGRTPTSGKRPRPTRRTIASAVASRALTPKRDREVSQAPSTSSAIIQNDQAGSSMPPSPGENSRSSNGAGSENDPALNLQPERLPFEVTNLFSQSDLGAYTGLKKMLYERWTRDFEGQHRQNWAPAKYKSALPRSKPKKTKLYVPPVQQPKSNGSSLDLMNNQLQRQKYLIKKHAEERLKLAGFIEREFKRQLNDIPARSKTAITCMRILSDTDIYNGNVMDIGSDDLTKVQPRERETIIAKERERLGALANNTLKQHQIEAETLYFEQCAEWERFMFDQLPIDKRAGVEDFSLRKCVKPIKTKRVNLDVIIR